MPQEGSLAQRSEAQSNYPRAASDEAVRQSWIVKPSCAKCPCLGYVLLLLKVLLCQTSLLLLSCFALPSVGIRHENLEAFDKEREYISNDSSFKEFAAKLSTMLSEPRDIQLYRYITQFPAGLPPAKYIHLVRFIAVGNKETEVQAALVKFSEARASEGAVAPAIWRRVISPEGNIFVAANRYENLTEYENITASRPSSISQLIQETADIITETPAHALFVPVVSMQR